MNRRDEFDEDDELLTAYLDGELQSGEQTQLQMRLMDDERLRGRLADLQKAWDLLDELPETPVNQEFTKSTLELVVHRAQVQHETVALKQSSKAWRFYGLWGLLGVASLLVGIASGAILQSRQARLERKQLVAVAGLPGFKVLETLDAVQEFAALDDLDLAAEQIEVLKSRLLYDIPDGYERRVQWVEGLSAQQQAILWTQSKELERVDPSEAERVRQLARMTEGRPDTVQLQRAVAVAGAIYENQSDEERQALRLLSAKERVARLKSLLAFYLRDWHAENLSDEDRKVFSSYAQQKDWRDAPRAFRALSMGQILPDQLFGVNDPVINELEELTPHLSEPLHRCLQQLGPNDQKVALLTWLMAAVMPFRNVSMNDLEVAYQEWESSKRDRAELGKFTESEAVLKEMARRKRVANGVRNGGINNPPRQPNPRPGGILPRNRRDGPEPPGPPPR